MAATNEVCN